MKDFEEIVKTNTARDKHISKILHPIPEVDNIKGKLMLLKIEDNKMVESDPLNDYPYTLTQYLKDTNNENIYLEDPEMKELSESIRAMSLKNMNTIITFFEDLLDGDIIQNEVADGIINKFIQLNRGHEDVRIWKIDPLRQKFNEILDTEISEKEFKERNKLQDIYKVYRQTLREIENSINSIRDVADELTDTFDQEKDKYFLFNGETLLVVPTVSKDEEKTVLAERIIDKWDNFTSSSEKEFLKDKYLKDEERKIMEDFFRVKRKGKAKSPADALNVFDKVELFQKAFYIYLANILVPELNILEIKDMEKAYNTLKENRDEIIMPDKALVKSAWQAAVGITKNYYTPESVVLLEDVDLLKKKVDENSYDSKEYLKMLKDFSQSYKTFLDKEMSIRFRSFADKDIMRIDAKDDVLPGIKREDMIELAFGIVDRIVNKWVNFVDIKTKTEGIDMTNIDTVTLFRNSTKENVQAELKSDDIFKLENNKNLSEKEKDILRKIKNPDKMRSYISKFMKKLAQWRLRFDSRAKELYMEINAWQLLKKQCLLSDKLEQVPALRWNSFANAERDYRAYLKMEAEEKNLGYPKMFFPRRDMMQRFKVYTYYNPKVKIEFENDERGYGVKINKEGKKEPKLIMPVAPVKPVRFENEEEEEKYNQALENYEEELEKSKEFYDKNKASYDKWKLNPKAGLIGNYTGLVYRAGRRRPDVYDDAYAMTSDFPLTVKEKFQDGAGVTRWRTKIKERNEWFDEDGKLRLTEVPEIKERNVVIDAPPAWNAKNKLDFDSVKYLDFIMPEKEKESTKQIVATIALQGQLNEFFQPIEKRRPRNNKTFREYDKKAKNTPVTVMVNSLYQPDVKDDLNLLNTKLGNFMSNSKSTEAAKGFLNTKYSYRGHKDERIQEKDDYFKDRGVYSTPKR
jgi:hypothetical protein